MKSTRVFGSMSVLGRLIFLEFQDLCMSVVKGCKGFVDFFTLIRAREEEEFDGEGRFVKPSD